MPKIKLALAISLLLAACSSSVVSVHAQDAAVTTGDAKPSVSEVDLAQAIDKARLAQGQVRPVTRNSLPDRKSVV